MELEKLAGSKQVIMASLLLSGLVAGGAVTYIATADSVPGEISRQQAGEKVVSTVERQTGQQLEVVKVEQRSGLYRVDARTGDDRLVTYFVTKDGELATSALSDLNRINQLLDARQQFSQCLRDRDVVLYGNLSQTATQLQLQVLGGVRYAAGIYKDVRSRENLQEAANRGVDTVPSFYYNGSVLPGVSRVQGIEQFTGCSFETG